MNGRAVAAAFCMTLVLAGCRDEERIRLKSENHRLRQDLALAKNRIEALEAELSTAQSLSAAPAQVPLDPSATATGGVGQRGPVTGPPVAAALAQFRRPARRATPVADEPALAAVAPEEAAGTPAEPSAELVPLSPDQLQALEQGAGG